MICRENAYKFRTLRKPNNLTRCCHILGSLKNPINLSMSGSVRSQLHEFYQRAMASGPTHMDLKPVYHTVTGGPSSPSPQPVNLFTCSLTLPALPPAEQGRRHTGMPEATFSGSGGRKKDAEAAAATVAMAWLSQQLAFEALMPEPPDSSLGNTIELLLTNHRVR